MSQHDHLINQLAENLGGWKGLDADAIESLSEQQFAEQLDHATIFRQVFGTENGQYVLKSLIFKYLRTRIVQPHDDQFSVGIRQGHADVVQDILFLIEFANTGGGRPTGTGAGASEE